MQKPKLKRKKRKQPRKIEWDDRSYIQNVDAEVYDQAIDLSNRADLRGYIM